VAMLALTIARDRTLGLLNDKKNGVFGVLAFLQKLISRPLKSTPSFPDIMQIKPSVFQGPDDQYITLQSAFNNVNLYFNHFVKRQQQNKLDKKLMRKFIARCAAVMGANNQVGLDMATPMFKGDVVKENTQSLIMYQIKNDPHYGATVQPRLFDLMDPVALGFIDVGEKLELPIIRIVFALGGRTCAISHVEKQELGNFTSYDIWISGLSPEVFCVVDENDQDTWNMLLSASRGWQKMYRHRDDITAAMMQNMNPLAADEEAFCAFYKHEDSSH